MYAIKNILVTTDFSEYSAVAVEYATSIATRFNATLHLLYVINEPMLGLDLAGTSGGVQASDTSRVTQLREAGAREEMQKFISEHVDEYTYVEQVFRTGHPFQEIITYAQEHQIDLIVMATHGRTGLAHMVMGSIAEKVVRHSPVPVLTVKPAEMIEPLITQNDVEWELHLHDHSASTSDKAGSSDNDNQENTK